MKAKFPDDPYTSGRFTSGPAGHPPCGDWAAQPENTRRYPHLSGWDARDLPVRNAAGVRIKQAQLLKQFQEGDRTARHAGFLRTHRRCAKHRPVPAFRERVVGTRQFQEVAEGSIESLLVKMWSTIPYSLACSPDM